MSESLGQLLVGAGVVLILIGIVTRLGGFSWFGRLPGDIRIEAESTRVYVPIVSMLIISLVLSLALYIIRRIF
jgi:uncharacterized protein HemY